MKRFTKVCLSLSGVLAIVGVILCIVGAVTGGRLSPFRYGNWCFFWNDDVDEDDTFFDMVSGEESFLYTEEETAGVKNLDINIKSGSLQIYESENDQIRLVVYSRRSELQNTIEGDTLKIKDNRESVWWRNSKLELHLYLPANKEFEQVSIDVSAGETDADTFCLKAKRMNLNVDAGSIALSAAEVGEDLSATVGAGEIDIEDLRAKDVKLDCGMGSIDIVGKMEGNVDADCGVGEINLELYDMEESFNYSIECGMGEVEIGDISYTSFGRERKIDNHAEKMMNLDCGVGTIEVEFN